MKSIVRYGILVFLCAISTHTLTAQLSGLYDYSADITVNESMIPGVTDLTNFVLLISLESNTEMRDTGNGGRIKSNGVDIVFAPNSSSVVGISTNSILKVILTPPENWLFGFKLI